MRKESDASRKEREEFEDARNAKLADVPIAFCQPIASLAWEESHSYGYQEVLNTLDDLIYTLRPAWEQYRAEIIASEAGESNAGN